MPAPTLVLPPSAQTLPESTATVTSHAAADLAALWAAVQAVQTVAELRDALLSALPALLVGYTEAASALAADWYDDLRDVLDVPGSFTASPALVDDDLGVGSLVGWGTAELNKRGQELLDAATVDVADLDPALLNAALARVEAGTQKRLADHARQTVMENATNDGKADGWQRIGNGDCDFCEALIARGAVYTRATVDFGAHDHCKCWAIPAGGGFPVAVRAYTPSTRGTSDARRQAIRNWLADRAARARD